jgi:hypothetical protein
VALFVDGDISARAGDRVLRVLGQGNRLVAHLDGLGIAGLLRHAVGPGGRRCRAVQRLDAALRWAELSLDVRFGDRLVARLGSNARPSLFGRIAGIPGAEIRLFALLGALIGKIGGRRRPPEAGATS